MHVCRQTYASLVPPHHHIFASMAAIVERLQYESQPSMATLMTGTAGCPEPSRDMQVLLAAGDYRDSRTYQDSRSRPSSKRYSVALRGRPDSCALAYADDDFVSPNMSDRSSLGSVRMASLITQKIDAPKTVKASFVMRTASTAASAAPEGMRHHVDPPTPTSKSTMRASLAISEFGDPYSGMAADSPSNANSHQDRRKSRVVSVSAPYQRVSRSGLESETSLHSLGDNSYDAAANSSKRLQEMLSPKMVHISDAPWTSGTGKVDTLRSTEHGQEAFIFSAHTSRPSYADQYKPQQPALQGLGIVIPQRSGSSTPVPDAKPQLRVPERSTSHSSASTERPRSAATASTLTSSSRKESVVPRPRSSSRGPSYSVLLASNTTSNEGYVDALKPIHSPAKSSLMTVTNIVRTRSPDPSLAIGTASPIIMGPAATTSDSPKFADVSPLRVRSRLPSGIQSALARTPSVQSAQVDSEQADAASAENEDSLHSASSSASSVSGGISGQASSASTSNTSIEAPPTKPTRVPPPMPEQIMCSNLKLISLDDAQEREKERVAQAAQARAARKKLKSIAAKNARDAALAELPVDQAKKAVAAANKPAKSKKQAFLKLFRPRDEILAEATEFDRPHEQEQPAEDPKPTPRLRVQHASPERRERRKPAPSPAPSLDLRPVSLFFSKMPTEYFAGATLENMPVRMARSEGALTPGRDAGLSSSYASSAEASRSQSPVSPVLLYESGGEATGAAAYRAKILDLEQRLAAAKSELAVYRCGGTPQSDARREDDTSSACSQCGCSCKSGTITSVLDRPRVRGGHANMFTSHKDRD